MWNYETVFRKLRNNEQGRYSVTRPYEAKQITDIMSNVLSITFQKLIQECVITDCTAGIGGDTISFSFLFKGVNAIEILADQFELLKLNCEKVKALMNNSGSKNYGDCITLYNCNFLDIIYTTMVKQDVIYIDPPWGGIGYKFTPKLKIYIGSEELKDIAKKMIKLALVVFIKVPLNADLTDIGIENKFIINNKKDIPSFYLIQLSNI